MSAPPQRHGVRDGTKHGPICPQSTQKRNGTVAPWLAEFEMKEDCLNLSVYSPQVRPDAKAPVMVWIHGGFARIGSGSRYDGKALAQHDAVVVTINYRLDRLGLFAHPALSAGQADEPLANYGLLDMRAALQWVHANIQAFGGDPGNVTIFGQSSGGVAVTALMASPLTRGLWANFARTGDPDGPGLPRWNAIGTGDLDLMVLDVPSSMQPDPFAPRIDYHLQRYAKLLATPQP